MNPNSMNPEESGRPGGAGGPEEPARPTPGTTPPGPSQPGPTSPGPVPPFQPAASQNFFDWIRSQGVSRGQDRWVGGVASGIAHRFGIDPLIVRGIFIVLALFAGIGVLLYGIGWALLPEPDGRIHVQEAGAGRWTGGMTGAVITTIIGLPGLGRGFWGWGWNGLPALFWTLFWMGGVFYLIYFLVQRNKARNGARNMGAKQFAAAPMTAQQSGSAGPGNGTSYEGGLPVYGAAPPSGPYGSGAYGSGRYGSGGPGNPSGPSVPSVPTPPHSRPPHAKRPGPGAAMVAVSAGAALLAGGALKALDAGNVINLGDAANAVVWAAGAAVLGLGILVAGLRGRTSGFMGFLAVVALIIGGIFNLVPNGDRFTMRDADWTPISIEQARDGFDITGGKGTVDLRQLGIIPPLTSELVVPVDATASNLTVVIPANVPVEVRADMTFGNLHQDGTQGVGLSDNRTSNYNTDKPGAKLIVKVSATFSNVTIQEGN
ncbi:PspC domain-containing protein [Arthrobacter sp. CJ23]|uniref:PspC domain-containing protein n=1 Tax=Arthrobacter sp. CJ23 TaxID=2972479 RepID=UPI00215C595A|nr:PspC domain-containing protein [Arthrobacter sp. CJ23]UVJ38586.1 PspC domain-containing protein [Arthrobacter sp. CJ23]